MEDVKSPPPNIVIVASSSENSQEFKDEFYDEDFDEDNEDKDSTASGDTIRSHETSDPKGAKKSKKKKRSTKSKVCNVL